MTLTSDKENYNKYSPYRYKAKITNRCKYSPYIYKAKITNS